MFAGAALYINVAEHPARMTLDTRFAAAQWAPSYRRATWMQAPLALLSLVAGVASWLLGGGLGWAIAAFLIGAVVPFTPSELSIFDVMTLACFSWLPLAHILLLGWLSRRANNRLERSRVASSVSQGGSR